jgi:hypothetical protein
MSKSSKGAICRTSESLIGAMLRHCAEPEEIEIPKADIKRKVIADKRDRKEMMRYTEGEDVLI